MMVFYLVAWIELHGELEGSTFKKYVQITPFGGDKQI